MVEITAIELPRDIKKYDLVRGFLEFRKAVFIDRLCWSLPTYRGLEFEQYDTFQSVYLIAHEGKTVIGGARLMRTDHTSGSSKFNYSYMIKDAFHGLLPGIPKGICLETPPVSRDVWELTRLAARPGTDAAKLILLHANRYLHQNGARTCLFLGPPAFLRLAKSLGFVPKPLGPVVSNKDGSFLAFSCEIERVVDQF